MLSTRRLGSLGVVTALLLGACSDNPLVPNNEEEQVTLDVASYAAEATVDDIVVMAGQAAVVLPSLLAGPPEGDLNVTRTVTFYDDNGVEMTAYDPLLTASVNIMLSMSGNRSRTGDRGTVTISVSRERDLTISGLLGQETQRTWNGSGSASANRSLHSDQRGDREYDISATTTITNVVMPVPRGSSWPLSGRITREVTVEVIRGLEDSRTRTRTVEIEFNGTSLVPITINGVTYTLDLENREILRSDG